MCLVITLFYKINEHLLKQIFYRVTKFLRNLANVKQKLYLLTVLNVTAINLVFVYRRWQNLNDVTLIILIIKGTEMKVSENKFIKIYCIINESND